MNADEIKEIRKISGRFSGSVKEELAHYHALGDNYAMKLCAALDLLSLVLNDLETVQADRDRVRRDTLLEAARAVCLGCANNKPLEFFPSVGSYSHKLYHSGGRYSQCVADAIHKLIAADAERGQGKES